MIRIMKIGETAPCEILVRNAALADVSETVRGILSDVRANGDRALFSYGARFDGAYMASLEVPKSKLERALLELEPEMRDVLETAKRNIENFHARQKQSGFVVSENEGVLLGQRVRPLERVGVYVPGGTAAYPSTVLMNCVPAKLAGVPELFVVTPAKGGVIQPVLLAAAALAGVDRVFAVGGAQAIAALAYGTETIPRVDKIVGPGNAYVAEAKRQVYGLVDIDMIAGPSEIVIVADETCNPEYVAADLLSQAEHDANASAVLITDSPALAESVSAAVEAQLDTLPRAQIARQAIERNGKILLAESIAGAIALSNALAPEHLELCLDNAFDYLGAVTNAGSIFLGKYCPEALGDYLAGPNHTLPTGGTARFMSPLSVEDFVKKSAFTYYSQEALSKIAGKIARFAEAEGLHAHARSATVRGEGLR